MKKFEVTWRKTVKSSVIHSFTVLVYFDKQLGTFFSDLPKNHFKLKCFQLFGNVFSRRYPKCQVFKGLKTTSKSFASAKTYTSNNNKFIMIVVLQCTHIQVHQPDY